MDSLFDGILGNISKKIVEGLAGKINKSLQGKKMDLKGELICVVNEAAKESFYECVAKEWYDEDFMGFLDDYMGEEDLSFIYDCTQTKRLFSQYFGSTAYHYAESQFIELFHIKCIFILTQNQMICNGINIKNLFQQEVNKPINQRKIKEYDHMLLQIKNDIDQGRAKGMYRRGLDAFYPFICDNLTKGCSDDLLEAAYFMADIYDHTSEYEKSIRLTDLVQAVIDPEQGIYSTHRLRQYIGSVCSYIVAKTGKPSDKEWMLQKAEHQLEVAKRYIDKWNFESVAEKEFIESLYEGNYAALWTNKADYAEAKHDRKKTDGYLAKALHHHQVAERKREHLLENFVPTLEVESIEDMKRYLYQSKSNIAGIFYRRGNYEEALNRHQAVLDYRLKINDMTNVYLSKAYIVGCYIEKMRAEDVLEKEKEECERFIDECKSFYCKKGDIRRFEDMRRKEEMFRSGVRSDGH